MDLLIAPDGSIRCLYSEAIRLAEFGALTIQRASYVEPNSHSQWIASLLPVGGPILGPFSTRGQALASEQAWLSAHWLSNDAP